MLLTETIKKTTLAIKQRRDRIEHKQTSEAYARALAQLAQATESIKESIKCANAMKENGIICDPIIDESTRQELLDSINDCGNDISENNSLSLETVRLLKLKGEAFATQIKVVWREAAQKYSDGPKGYLSMIGGLTDDPKMAHELADNITETVSGVLSVRSVNNLVAKVGEAKQITEKFSLSHEIEIFLKKVSLQRATVLDLTPDVMNWLKEKNLTGKLKIRF